MEFVRTGNQLTYVCEPAFNRIGGQPTATSHPPATAVQIEDLLPIATPYNRGLSAISAAAAKLHG